MPVLARNVSTPISIEVRPGAVAALAPLLADGRISMGGEVAILVGAGRGHGIADELREHLPQATIFTLEGGDLEAAQTVTSQLRGRFFDAVVGIGGGRTIDCAKYAASMVGLPFVSVATTLTHDGLASPVASLDIGGRKASFGVQTPIAVFVDIDHVRSAPVEHLRSGLGDVLSNLSAVRDWELANEVTGEPIDGLAVTLARSPAHALLLRDGTFDDATLTVLAEGLILSGLAMTVAGNSRPCSGACHEISHAIDAWHGGPGLHGEQVAIGALFASWLRGDTDLAADLDACLRRFDAPRLPADLGLDNAAFAAAVSAAPRTRPDRFTVLEHLDLSAGEVVARVDEFVETFAG